MRIPEGSLPKIIRSIERSDLHTTAELMGVTSKGLSNYLSRRGHSALLIKYVRNKKIIKYMLKRGISKANIVKSLGLSKHKVQRNYPELLDYKKLGEEDLERIQELLANRVLMKDVAAMYGVDRATIRRYLLKHEKPLRDIKRIRRTKKAKKLIAKGLTNAQVAKELNMSYSAYRKAVNRGVLPGPPKKVNQHK